MRVIRSVVKAAAVGWDLLSPPTAGITILLYHRVGAGSTSDVDLPINLFTRQMSELAESGRAISLDAAVDSLLIPGDGASDGFVPTGARGGGPVVVTFDDGTSDVVDTAMPILEEHAVPATLFVATRFIDEQRQFPDDGRPATWAGLRDAIASGLLKVGSHTHSHALMDRITAHGALSELDRSIGLIEEHLGVAPSHFAYPKAVPGNSAAEALVRSRFRSASLAGTVANRPGSADVFRLTRSPIQTSDRMWFARRKVDGGLVLEDRIRVARNRRRYSGLTR